MPQNEGGPLTDPVGIEHVKRKMDRIGINGCAQAAVTDLLGAEGVTYTMEEVCEKHCIAEEDLAWVMRRLLSTVCPARRLKDYTMDDLEEGEGENNVLHKDRR